jgi:hypothetical protein
VPVVSLPFGTTEVVVSSIPSLVADARWPDTKGKSHRKERVKWHAVYDEVKCDLPGAVEQGQVRAFNSVTGAQQTLFSDTLCVRVGELRSYLKRWSVDLSVQPDWTFWLAMRKLEIWQASALSMGIDPDSLRPIEHAWMNGPGSGPLFSDECFGSHAEHDTFLKRCRLLDSNRSAPPFKPCVSREEWHRSEVLLVDFVTWCKSIGLAPLPTDLATFTPPVATSNAMEEQEPSPPSRPLPRQRFQEEEILRALVKLGYAPTALPVNPQGKPGVKAECRNWLKSKDEQSWLGGVFDRAWIRLRADGRIRDAL